MKKFIALTVSASLLFSSAALTADALHVRQRGVDVVSAATNTTTPTTPVTKPTTPVTKPTTPVTKPSTPTTPVKKPSTPAAKPVVQKPYQDGVFVAYGNAYSKGTEGAKVTLKDGKIVDVELLRTSPKLIDRDARNNYKGLWQAYEIMKKSFIGKTREQAAKVDIVSGATRSSEGWKLSVDRAFARAQNVKTAGQVYFEGDHMGVDPQGKFMVFAKYDKATLKGIKVYPLSASGSAIEEAAMTAEQAKTSYLLANELIYRGLGAQPVKGLENETKAVVNALWDAEQNAKVSNGVKYIDGFYSAYGTARDKGVERADIYIRNGKLVDVKLFRLGADLKDRGNTAYASVVAANAPMVAKLLENGSYIANYTDADAISGATESSHSWNQAVERAFVKAAKAPAKNLYADGIFAGADNESKILLVVEIKNNVQTKVTSYLFGDDKKLIKDEALTADQKDMLSKINAGLLKSNRKMADIKGYEEYSAIAREAYTDMLANAITRQSNFKDGVFTAYGNATDKGSNRVDLTLRNGQIVDIKLARVGVNLVDRGETAYAEVVKAIPQLIKSFMSAGTKEAAQKVDVVTGATSSSNEFKLAIQRAYDKTERVEAVKAAYHNGTFAGVDAAKSVYVMTTNENGVPVKMLVYFLDEAGKIKTEDKLSADELAVKTKIEASNGTAFHEFGYNPAAFGDTDAVKALSAKVVEAIKAAQESAGK